MFFRKLLEKEREELQQLFKKMMNYIKLSFDDIIINVVTAKLRLENKKIFF